MKNCKTFYETQTTSRLHEIIKSPPAHPYQIKSYYAFGTTRFLRRYTEILGHLLSKCFKNAVLGSKKYFQKNDLKYVILKHLYFGPNFVFWGRLLGDSFRAF